MQTRLMVSIIQNVPFASFACLKKLLKMYNSYLTLCEAIQDLESWILDSTPCIPDSSLSVKFGFWIPIVGEIPVFLLS